MSKASAFKTFVRKSKKDMKCHYCGVTGHFGFECEKKKADSKRKDGKSGNRDSNGNSNGSCSGFVAASLIATVNLNLNYDANATSTEREKLCSISQVEDWLADSGASCHMTFRRDWFSEYKELPHPISVALGDDTKHKAIGTGTIVIKRKVKGIWLDGILEGVLHIPSFKRNLYSTNVPSDKGFYVNFRRDSVQIIDPESENIMAVGLRKSNNICVMLFRVVKPEANAADCRLGELHRSLGHVNIGRLKKMVNTGAIEGVESVIDESILCKGCRLGKSHRKPSSRVAAENINYGVGECLHVDLSGRSDPSLGGAQYFMLIKDKMSGFRHIYFLKHKNDAIVHLKDHCIMLKNIFGISVKRVPCDNGLEFINAQFKDFLIKRGIQICTSAPYCPEQNGTIEIERDNRTVCESARSMLHDCTAPRNLWAEAVNTAIYAMNRTTSVNTGRKTPFELWYGRKPNVEHMLPFWTRGYSHIPKQFRKKWDAKAEEVFLAGYQEDANNYRVYNPISKRIMVVRDVDFDRVDPDDETDIVIKLNKNKQTALLESERPKEIDKPKTPPRTESIPSPPMHPVPPNSNILPVLEESNESGQSSEVDDDMEVEQPTSKRKVADTSFQSHTSRPKRNIKKTKASRGLCALQRSVHAKQ